MKYYWNVSIVFRYYTIHVVLGPIIGMHILILFHQHIDLVLV